MINERNLPKIHGIILEDLTELTLVELSRACAVHADRIVELVDEGVLFPSGVEMHHGLGSRDATSCSLNILSGGCHKIVML